MSFIAKSGVSLTLTKPLLINLSYFWGPNYSLPATRPYRNTTTALDTFLFSYLISLYLLHGTSQTIQNLSCAEGQNPFLNQNPHITITELLTIVLRYY